MMDDLYHQAKGPRLHTGRLVLTPEDRSFAPDLAHLGDGLAGMGLVGQAIDETRHTFYAGPALLALIAFSGCAVRVALDPNDSATGAFSHVRLLGPYPRLQLRYGRNTRPPRCPKCRARLPEWWTALHPERIKACPRCAARVPALGWDWRQQGGIGRFFIDIEEVFPGEAHPTPAFMRSLEDHSNCPWHHFYLQDTQSRTEVRPKAMDEKRELAAKGTRGRRGEGWAGLFNERDAIG